MKLPEIRTEIEAGEGPDGEDIVKTIDGQTGAILKVEIITTDGDGQEVRVPLSSKKVSRMAPVPATPKASGIPTVDDMIRLAEEMKAGATRQEIINYAGTLLEECKQHVLEGSYEELVPEEIIKPEMLSSVVKYLKELGYKVKRTPAPGEGTWIKISWPTSLKKRKQAAGTESTVAPSLGQSPQRKPIKKHLLNNPDTEVTMVFKEKKPS